jgi:hypothetical protein
MKVKNFAVLYVLSEIENCDIVECYVQLEDSTLYEYREPEQAPISPPYAHFLSLQHNHKIRTLH